MTYQLASSTEAERQLIQDQAWLPETEALLDRIGIQPGWRCLDLGCGAGGMLDVLAERAGPDGEVVGVEPDHDTLDYLPPSPAWRLLKQALLALVRRHSDPNLGRRALELLHGAGLRDLELRTAILQLTGGHPYMSMPLMAVRGAQDRLVQAGLISATELDTLLEEVEELVSSPETIHVSVLSYQVWGKRPMA